jgi:hypothetical protein
MAEAVPTPDEIMALAHDVLELAVKRRGESELNHPAEGTETAGFYAMLRQGYSWIVDAFGQAVALAPDPGSFQPLIEAARQGETTLTGGAELHLSNVDINGNVIRGGNLTPVDPFWWGVNGINAKMSEWTGDAADNFRDNFLAHVSAVPANHAMVFRSLHFSLTTTKKVYEQYLRDLKEVATKARAALHPAACHPPSLKVVLGLAAGVSKIAAGLATAAHGGLFVVGEGVVELAATTMEAGEKGGKGETIDGPDVEWILQSANDLLNRTMSLLDQREQEIASIINDNYNTLTSATYSGLFVVPEPTGVASAATKPVKQLHNEFD